MSDSIANRLFLFAGCEHGASVSNHRPSSSSTTHNRGRLGGQLCSLRWGCHLVIITRVELAKPFPVVDVLPRTAHNDAPSVIAVIGRHPLVRPDTVRQGFIELFVVASEHVAIHLDRGGLVDRQMADRLHYVADL